MQFLTACIASLELLQITCGCSTDGPECESSRENEGQDAELGQAARSHLGSRVFLRVSDPANLANRTICDYFSKDPPLLHFELPKLPKFDSDTDPDLSPVNFDFDADPEPGPAFDFDTDPDQAALNDADPCRSGCYSRNTFAHP